MSSFPNIHEFEQIHNFRDVGRSINAFIQPNDDTDTPQMLKEGLLFRSGRLDQATGSDVDKLNTQFSLKTVLDLRTRSEHIQSKKRMKKRINSLGDDEKEPLLAVHREIPEWQTFKVDLVGETYEHQMLKELGFFRALYFLILMVLGYRMKAINLLGRHVLAPKGVVGLNLDMLKFCQAEIYEASALNVLINPLSYPALIHCTQGKDRSGIIVILVLFVLLNLDNEEGSDTHDMKLDAIKHDYMLSVEGLSRIRQSMIAEVKGIGMTEDYLEAPASVVDAVYKYLVERYGGAEPYLDAIGFGEEKRNVLKKEGDDSPENEFKLADTSVLKDRPMKGLPKRGARLGNPAPAEGPSSKPVGSAFKGFGLDASFTFNAPSSTPASTSTSSATPAPAVSSTATSAAKSMFSFIPTSTTNAPPKPSPLSSQPTIADLSSDPVASGEDPAHEYYKSLRGLNVSLTSTVSELVNKDPFVDIGGLLEHYKTHRSQIQKKYDEKNKLKFTSSTATIPSSGSFSANPSSGMPTPPASFAFPGAKEASAKPSTTTGGGFTPTLGTEKSSSSFSFPSAAPLLSSNAKPTALAFSLTPSSTPSTTTAPAPSPFAFKTSTETTSTNLFGKPAGEKSSAPLFGGAANGFAFGVSSSTPDKSPASTTPPTPPQKSAFGGFGVTKTSPGGGSIGNPVGFGFGASAGISTGFGFGAAANPSPFGATTTNPSPFGGTALSTPPASQETASSGGGSSTSEATGDGSHPRQEGEAQGLFGPNVNDVDGEGEEDEETVHSIKSKVYKMKREGGKTSWAELGTGLLKLKKHKTSDQRRMLLRNSSTGKININFNLYAGLKPTLTQKAISFVGHEDGQPQTYSVRVKTEDQAREFKDILDREITFVKAKSSD